MKIDISSILRDSLSTIDVDLIADAEVRKLFAADVSEFGNVVLKGTLINMNKVINFDGELVFDYVAECSRCLGTVKQEACKKVMESFYNPSVPNDDVEYFYEGKVIDFTKFIVDEVALNLPVKHLCKSDCSGLCPMCGQNLNLEQCGCEYVNIDPRLEKLRDLLK